MHQSRFHHLLLMGRPQVPAVPETLQALKNFLLTLPIKISVEAHTAQFMNTEGATIAHTTALPNTLDLIVVVGGDGSLLTAAHLAIQHDLPIIGVHRGRLGFLTDIHPNCMEKIKEVIEGRYREETRELLTATVTKHAIYDLALNDVVLMPSETPQMLEFETYIDNVFVCKQRADGLIIATPTGSTAYALSAGGPILKPDLQAVVMTPMCPHTLSSRPIVVSNEAQIMLRLTSQNKGPINMSCDGINRIPLDPGSEVLIKKHVQRLKLVHPLDYDYFTTLREKLGWEKHAERT